MKPFFNFLGFKTENELINMQSDNDWQINGQDWNAGYVKPRNFNEPRPDPNTLWPWMQDLSKQESPRGVIEEQDPSGRPLNSPGAKADSGKLRPWLVLGQFSNALEEVSKVGTAGAKKYTENGWLTVENGKNRYMDAAMRHLLEIGKGNQLDDGPTGIYTKHIANAIWNLLAVLELEEREESSSKT
jgi:hypothetical protein